MKKLFFSLLILSSFPAFSQVIIHQEARVLGASPEVIKELIESGSVEIDHVSSQGFEVFGGKGLFDYLDSKGLPYLDLRSVNEKAFAGYPNFDEVTKRLKAAEAKNPSIIKVFSIGQSVKGRDLWFAKISDNVGQDEVEPEFKYISSMHGDEITGRELTLSFIEEIAENYGKDPDITNMVNNTEIFIMPSMNPDGSEMKRRANAKGVDLNRNFPDLIRDTQNSSSGREIETQHVMKFQASRQFALSANFHGGTIVVNYPWDTIYDLHPMDALVRELSSAYAEHNPDMRNSSEFSGGMTNGASWYVVRGGMQDWSYKWHNDLQVTVELSHDKWPDYSEIPQFYQDNRDSMMSYMKRIHQGAGFKFSRKGVSGTVMIQQVSPVTKDLGSYSFTNSEFYKVLPEGDFTFTVLEKDGSSSQKTVKVQRDFISPDGNYLVLQ